MPKAKAPGKAPAASSKGKKGEPGLPPGMRAAQRGDFPKLIPFHSGHATMFQVSTKEGEEDW
eukprot:11225640-Lingulodinium_polyedra.AAC.1